MLQEYQVHFIPSPVRNDQVRTIVVVKRLISIIRSLKQQRIIINLRETNVQYKQG